MPVHPAQRQREVTTVLLFCAHYASAVPFSLKPLRDESVNGHNRLHQKPVCSNRTWLVMATDRARSEWMKAEEP